MNEHLEAVTGLVHSFVGIDSRSFVSNLAMAASQAATLSSLPVGCFRAR